MKAWIKVIGILFVLPVFALIFFQYAPKLENSEVRDQFLKSIERNTQSTDEVKAQQKTFISSLDFHAICKGQVADSQALIEELQIADVCESFERFSFAQILSLALVGLGILHLLTTWFLGQMAGKSRTALISHFRLGWRTSTLFSLLILLGQTVIAVFFTYYLTVLFTNRYYPKLLLMIIVGGGWAFFKVAKLIISHIPIESNESAAEAVTEAQAPKLWQAVRNVAQKIGTQPPEHILMGLTTSFYVTEFPVRHTAGVTSGRILYLSEPMMRQMPLDEITAIIGHEMGHFHGEDTALTRELSPLLVKSDRTMGLLAEAGWVGAPAMHAMGVFSYFFEKSISAFRRERELLADAAGASITSAKSAALALARYSYASEIYSATLDLHVLKKIPKEEAHGEVMQVIRTSETFWKDITEHRTPHPFDSHPPLSIRTEKLGFAMAELQEAAMQPVALSAYDQLIGTSEILAQAHKEHAELVENAQQRMQLKTATPEASEDQKALLEKHFPTVVLKFQTKRLWWMIGIYIFLVALFGVVFLIAIPGVGFKIAGVITIALGFYFIRDYIQDWKDQTLTLTSESVKLNSWKEPLLFKDIKQMRVMSQNGTTTLYLDLNEKRPPIAKRPIVRWARRAYAIDITGFPPSPETVANQIYKYYLREM
jgi:Zn-dependent protease with chaperone function